MSFYQLLKWVVKNIYILTEEIYFFWQGVANLTFLVELMVGLHYRETDHQFVSVRRVRTVLKVELAQVSRSLGA